jgi:hypothetical protein
MGSSREVLVKEWPDVVTAVRALAAVGPYVPAIGTVGYEAFCEALSEDISPICDRDIGVRITSEPTEGDVYFAVDTNDVGVPPLWG